MDIFLLVVLLGLLLVILVLPDHPEGLAVGGHPPSQGHKACNCRYSRPGAPLLRLGGAHHVQLEEQLRSGLHEGVEEPQHADVAPALVIPLVVSHVFGSPCHKAELKNCAVPASQTIVSLEGLVDLQLVTCEGFPGGDRGGWQPAN